FSLKTILDQCKLMYDIMTKLIDPNASISSTILPARKKIHINIQLPVHKINFANPSFIINDEHFAEIPSSIINNENVAKVP
ncbi:23021_t:CDS:2, partial [Gigaspora rosea]